MENLDVASHGCNRHQNSRTGRTGRIYAAKWQAGSGPPTMAESAERTAVATSVPCVDDVVVRAAGGYESARTELVERSRHQVFGWCRRILGDAERAEDATQVALLQLWQHIHSLNDPRAFSAWLYRTTVNACLGQRLRDTNAGRPRPVPLDDARSCFESAISPTPEELAVARAELARLVATLRTPERELLSMKYARDMSAREIGAKLHISEGAARTRLHAVLQRLRRLVHPGDQLGR